MTSASVDQADHHKHMEFVQAVITRLANNSFLLKGWALTLVSALLGFAISQAQVALALAAFIPSIIFWLLDTYYLRQERAFRTIYKAVAARIVTDFEIDPAPYVQTHSWRDVGFSISLRLFYGTMIILSGVVALSLALLSSPESNPSPYQIHVINEGDSLSNTIENSRPPANGTEPSPSQTVLPTPSVVSPIPPS